MQFYFTDMYALMYYFLYTDNICCWKVAQKCMVRQWKISKEQVIFFRVKQLLWTEQLTRDVQLTCSMKIFPLLKDMKDISHLKVCLSFLHPHISFMLLWVFNFSVFFPKKMQKIHKINEQTETQCLKVQE